MEPQLEGCGKMMFLFRGKRILPLQWSRNLRVAESIDATWLDRLARRFNGAAT